MANVKILAPFILSFEGGFVKDPRDRGGATNRGVTLRTWQAYGYDKNSDGRIDEKDIRLISDRDAVDRILKPHFWDPWQADNPAFDQSLANILVDWGWASGVRTAVRQLQKLLGLKKDGIVGPKTLAAITAADPADLFSRIASARAAYIESLCKANPSQICFRNGWLRRLGSIHYRALVYNDGSIHPFP